MHRSRTSAAVPVVVASAALATVDQDHVYDGDTGAGACTLGPLVDPRQGGLLVDSS